MAKLTDNQIKAWIKSNTRFEGKSDGGGLYLYYRKTFSIPRWRFRFRFAGKQEAIDIGDYGNLSLSDARKQAKELSARVSLGYNVANEKRDRKAEVVEQREAKANAFTAGQLADRYFNDQVAGNVKYPNIIRSKIEKDIKPYIGKLAVDQVKPMHIDAILKNVVDRGAPTVANDVLRILKHMFNYAIKRHIVEYNPASAFDLSDAGGKESSRDRYLIKEELISFFDAMRKAKGFSHANLITMRLLLMLGVRKSELIEAKLDDFDLEAGTWTLTKDNTKTKTGIVIPLPKQAIDSINELIGLSESSKWLLPARKAQDRRLPHICESTLNVALKKVLNAMPEGMEPFTIHDFRRTARTHIESLGFPPHIGERCINHKIKGVEGVYNRYDYFDERAKALQALANFIESCEGDVGFNVIPFKQKA
ncbi:MAG: tyrosine-type recombinase/integrase [Gammaproteobacteria bacterium]|jgi:integrase|nr:tyrosine-type recombinase/integrase [Gammaproteobacteria bacterium]MBT6420334.1 tyrosine-type recombinase/integrase [Gammaproteobacteria bacterium]MBT6576065.1 tyrosine-type recombinase/integrase [Gammaproteobacteria bacterium]